MTWVQTQAGLNIRTRPPPRPEYSYRTTWLTPLHKRVYPSRCKNIFTRAYSIYIYYIINTVLTIILYRTWGEYSINTVLVLTLYYKIAQSITFQSFLHIILKTAIAPLGYIPGNHSLAKTLGSGNEI
jgi:hypothetical protein